MCQKSLVAARYRSDQRWWARSALTGGVESWLPGQATRPHDHGGASGSFTVVRGTLTETFRYPRGSVQRGERQAGETVAFGAAARTSSPTPGPSPIREYASLADLIE